MQYTTALSLLFLAMAGPVSVLGQGQVDVTVWESATTIVTVTADAGAPTPPANNAPPVEDKVADGPPPAAATTSASPPPPSSSAAAPSGGNDGPPGQLQSSGGKICINFSGNNDFHFLNTGSWGSNSGSGTQAASQCFDPSENAGMFICENECQASGDSSTAKYTKLECTLGGQYQNCDVSLVDGFSLPLECTVPGALPLDKMGGLTDLETLNHCPTGGDDGTCKNANAYHPDASAVDEYFQIANWDPKKPNGNNYCTFQFCGPYSDIFFSDTPTIECKVGYRTASSSSTSKRDIVSQREEGLAARSRTRRHSHGHAHVRGLKDLGV